MQISGFRRTAMAGAFASALALAPAACSDSGEESGGTDLAGAGPTTESSYTTPLQGICPDTVVVQTNWLPEADHGFTYRLLGPNPTIDKDGNRVTGQLGATGVKLEIRAGGPAVGFQPVSAIMAQDDDVLLGYVNMDDAIKNSGSQPTIAVFAALEKSPLALIWGDPGWEFTSVADIGRSGATVLASEGAAYLDVFVREGLLKSSQIDTSYQGTPDRFVAADGKIAQQGVVTHEPYVLEHDVKAWSKPVDYVLIHNEYPVYTSPLAIRQDKLEANRDCLSKLVPLFQQAQHDYVADPGPTNQLLLDVVGTLDTGGFGLSPGLLADANTKQTELGLIADGSDGVLGSFDTTRVQKLIDKLVPVFEAQGTAPKAGLAPAELATNEFLDESISLN